MLNRRNALAAVATLPALAAPAALAVNTAIQQLFGATQQLSDTLATLFVGRTSIISGYNVQNSDKNSKLGLNGGFFTLTFNDPSTYDLVFSVTIVNEDTTAAKTIVLTNYADGTNYSFFLWPLQSYLVYSDNGKWFLLGGPQRWEMPNITIFYVDPAGNDANDGLDATRPLTGVSVAWSRIQSFTVGSVRIQMKLGATFGSIGELDGDSTGNFGRIIEIQGDPSLVNPPVVNVGPSTLGVKFRDGAWASVGGVRFVGGSSSTGVAIEQASLVDLSNIDFGSFALGTQVAMSDQCLCNISGTNKISGGAGTGWFVGALCRLFVNGSFNGAGAARAFSNAFLVAQGLSYVDFSGASFSNVGSFTGQKYNLSLTSVASSGGVVLPGNVAGSVDATSVYV